VDSDIAVIPSSAVRFIDDKDDLAVLLFSQSWSSPKYLEEKVKRDGCVTPWVGEKLSGADILAGDSYRSRWDHAPVFSKGTTGEMQLGIELSPGLQSREFQAADLPAEAQKASRQPWQAVMQVEIGNDGRVEDVFLEGGSGNQALDAVLVQWAYRGKVSRAGERCGGRVAVNFGAR
jgi:hypothetical protein